MILNGSDYYYEHEYKIYNENEDEIVDPYLILYYILKQNNMNITKIKIFDVFGIFHINIYIVRI